MPEKKYRWYKIAGSITELQFGDSKIVTVEIADKKICIASTSNGLAACSAKCPHAGGNMGEGYLNKEMHIVCPVHGYQFNLLNGRDVTGEGYFLKIYPVKVDDAGIFLGIEESGLLRWLK